MTPPLPSPPIIAFLAFIISTTFTSPTFELKYSHPYLSVTSFKPRVDDILETVEPFSFDKTKSEQATNVFSSPNNTPSSHTNTNLSTSGSTAIPKSAFSLITVFFKSVKFLSSGSGLWEKSPFGLQFIFTTSQFNFSKSSGIIIPPLELIPSTTTLNFFLQMPSTFT